MSVSFVSRISCVLISFYVICFYVFSMMRVCHISITVYLLTYLLTYLLNNVDNDVITSAYTDLEND